MARRRRRKSSAGSLGLVAGGVAALLVSAGIVAGMGYLYLREAERPVLDEQTLCPVTGPTSATAVLLDTTDPISTTTAIDLRNEFQKLVEGIPAGGLMEVYLLTEREGELTRTFSGCNPGAGDSVDEWTSNPRMVQKRWEEGFQKPLDQIGSTLGTASGAERSPIMAAIQAIKLTVFARLDERMPKRLIVASDMLEHTDAFSVYRNGLDNDAYRGSTAHDRFRTNLEGIDVRFLAFQREGGRFPMTELASFWKTWIETNRGTFAGFVRLEGM